MHFLVEHEKNITSRPGGFFYGLLLPYTHSIFFFFCLFFFSFFFFFFWGGGGGGGGGGAFFLTSCFGNNYDKIK